MSLPADFPALERHTFIPQDGSADCRRCGMPYDTGGLHPERDPAPVPQPHSFQAGDVVYSPVTRSFMQATPSHYSGLMFVPLIPIAEAQPNPPAEAVLVVRDGQPVVNLDGDLYAVRSL